ncbi:N2227-domain-containing protein [Trichodelitschia bisporula]|uniref:N2227-domain-containing protein n=1 Tax=Trichodelitschia bisporula TaxID=703511 RepID=A0A6G1I5Y0_9PEZI|nr:N2227-domain-containing protein [Trichodelitschia bisporula]
MRLSALLLLPLSLALASASQEPLVNSQPTDEPTVEPAAEPTPKNAYLASTELFPPGPEVAHLTTGSTLDIEPPLSPRHEKAKAQLLDSLIRTPQNWARSHPRYRLLEVLHGLRRHEYRYVEQLREWGEAYQTLPEAQRELIRASTTYHTNFDLIRNLWPKNGALATNILEHALEYYEMDPAELASYIETAEAQRSWDYQPSITDALNHLVRDWTADGAHEREPTYAPILATIKDLLAKHPADAGTFKVLVPGAGLGRLAHEIAALDPRIEVTANEYSAYMNTCYRYVTTLRTPSSTSWHPYINWWSHQPSLAETTRAVHMPDVSINSSSVLWIEGDFLREFASEEGAYHAIVSLFFIDTAKSSLDYLDAFSRLLVPGGSWLNLGPLLYGSSPKLQLNLNDLLAVSEAMGFAFQPTPEEFGPLTLPHRTARARELGYLYNARSMRRNTYQAQFWVARKESRTYTPFPPPEAEPYNFAPGSHF